MEQTLKEKYQSLEQKIRTPETHYTPFELFTKEDEQTVRIFLLKEEEQKTFLPKYEGTILDPSEQYKKGLKDLVKKTRKSASDLSKLLERGSKIIEFTGTGEDELENLCEGLYQSADVGVKRYECILAYTKQIAETEQKTPLEIVQDESNRTEILKRTYGSGETYKNHRKTHVELMDLAMKFGTNTLSTVREKLDPLFSIPLIGRIFEWYFITRHVNKLPSKVACKAYKEDLSAFLEEKTYDIFGDTSSVERFI